MKHRTSSDSIPARVTWLILFCCFFLYRSVAQQATLSTNAKESNSPALYGEVRDILTGNKLRGALISVRRSALGGRSNEKGNYNIQLSSLPDTSTVYFFLCTHPSYRSANIIVHGRIHQPLNININMVKGDGNSTAEYQIDPETGKADLLSAY